MTIETHQRLTSVALSISVGLNVSATAIDLLASRYHSAALTSGFLAALLLTTWGFRATQAWFLVRLARAKAELALAEEMLARFRAAHAVEFGIGAPADELGTKH